MSTFKRYDEDFKQSSTSAKQVKLEENTVLTTKQIQKRNAQLEEENLTLKKRGLYSHKTPNKIQIHLSTPI